MALLMLSSRHISHVSALQTGEVTGCLLHTAADDHRAVWLHSGVGRLPWPHKACVVVTGIGQRRRPRGEKREGRGKPGRDPPSTGAAGTTWYSLIKKEIPVSFFAETIAVQGIYACFSLEISNTLCIYFVM
ncbi:hypothetical protein EI42_05915 [Thermosporothrix hazakensis]|uniref:Uncharacterized protein n=1 Tax=Thermosporothrix hazakensis TaxID=644383 RepID=A0A326TV63_THEHA|nr:hypothetical protein EI42_05915 [Thermosporothrix hazakensis]